MTSVDRRAFLKGAAAVSAAAAFAGAGRPLHGTSLPESAVTWKRAPCRLCGVGCGLLIGLEGGRPVAVKGDPDSPVGRGLACVKGYHAAQVLTGPDRITQAMVRRNGVLVAVPLREALDLVAQRLQATVEEHGKDSVALYGSAQWTIPDAYIASKLFKGGLGTNNVDTSTRLYAASGMSGLEASFGLDGSVGCYEDVDQAEIIVLWDVNLAESDPVLFSRMLARRRQNPSVRIIDVSTRTTRTSNGADRSVLFVPSSALALANGLCHEVVARKWVHREFVDHHVAFKRGQADLDAPTSDDTLRLDVPVDVDWDEYVGFLADYTPQRTQQLTGVPAATIRWLASLYGDRSRKVVSVWGAGINQDARGTWTNNALHNLHLLVGKVATPGNGSLCLTGQPSGGSAVSDAGSLAGTLPRGRVENAEDRRRAAEIWGIPPERIDPTPGRHALSLFRALDRGDVRFLWVQATNPMMSLPNVDRYRRAAARADRFLVVTEAYQTPTTDVADVILPAAIWIEREGVYGNAERQTQHFAALARAPGAAASDAWHMIEVARRLGFSELFPYDPASYVEEIWEEYRRFHPDPDSALPPLSVLRGQAGARWPFVQGQETKWRFNTAHDPAADPARGAIDFYGHQDHRAWIWLRPHQAAAESPDDAYPMWLVAGAVLEHSGGGAMTRRVPTLQRALPHGYVEINDEDAAARGIRNGERVRVISRRGAIDVQARINYRSQPPRGQLFAPWFDEAAPVHRLAGESSCPLSGQPDSRKCAVRLERLSPGRGD